MKLASSWSACQASSMSRLDELARRGSSSQLVELASSCKRGITANQQSCDLWPISRTAWMSWCQICRVTQSVTVMTICLVTYIHMWTYNAQKTYSEKLKILSTHSITYYLLLKFPIVKWFCITRVSFQMARRQHLRLVSQSGNLEVNLIVDDMYVCMYVRPEPNYSNYSKVWPIRDRQCRLLTTKNDYIIRIVNGALHFERV